MIAVSRSMRYVRKFAGFLVERASNENGVVIVKFYT